MHLHTLSRSRVHATLTQVVAVGWVAVSRTTAKSATPISAQITASRSE